MTIRVVLADDQAVVRAGFRTILETQADIAVVGEAGDGAHAVLTARRLRPDLVLMDVRMPGVDGLAATGQLAGRGIADPIAVLVVTTFDLDDDVFAAMRAGARPSWTAATVCRRSSSPTSTASWNPAPPRPRCRRRVPG